MAHRNLGYFLIFLTVLPALGCARPAPRTSVIVGPPSGSLKIRGEIADRHTIATPLAVGVSGSCDDGEAHWMVTERSHQLLREARDGSVETFSIEGVSADFDLEGLACRSGRFYMSTETEETERTEDKVFLVELAPTEPSGGSAHVSDTLSLQYPAPMKAGKNQGLEGLCIAGDWLIAAGEIRRTTASGLRQAPILRKNLSGQGTTHVHWVNLTSKTGKLSGLDCRERGGVIEVFAIERHYEVSRVLQFDLGKSSSQIQTTVELGHLISKTENYEAIVVDKHGRVTLNNDNQYTTITGPSEEVALETISALAH